MQIWQITAQLRYL